MTDDDHAVNLGIMQNSDPSLIRSGDFEQDLLAVKSQIYQIWWRWADFHLYVTSPTLDPIIPHSIILPQMIPETNEYEFVYPIHDHGFRFSVSKGDDMYVAGMSMCKLYFTIEKIIYLLIERLKSGGIDKETEVRVAFDGHQLCQRKAFESVINLAYNVVITNFDPGVWGERYLQIAKRLADMGYGYPTEAPRNSYRQTRSSSTNRKR